MNSIQAIGKWDKAVGVPLRTALAVSMDVLGRDGETACRGAIVMMAQSARSLTKQSPKNRKVERDNLGKFLTVYKKGNPLKMYEFQFSESYRAKNPDAPKGTFEDARTIGARGLAKRSWTWGMRRIGVRPQQKPIAGVGRLLTIERGEAHGYVFQDRLSYITKTLPAGWETIVETRAGNRIMGAARNKLMRRWRSAVGAAKGAKIPNEDLARFFSGGAE